MFKKCLSVLDENGRFAPVYDENQTKTVACSHVSVSYTHLDVYKRQGSSSTTTGASL